MHYLRSYYALQVPGVPQPAAAGPQGPGGHNNFSDSALAGLLIIIISFMIPKKKCSKNIFFFIYFLNMHILVSGKCAS